MKALRITLYAIVALVVLGSLAYWQRYQIAWNMLWVVKPSEQFSVVGPAPDYAHAGNWALRTAPDGADASVFYVHPTSYFQGQAWNQPLAVGYEDRFLLDNLMPGQVTPFAAYATFAPHFRQAILYGLQEKSYGSEAINLARKDVAAAFDHFLETAPTETVILVGHSQGALLASGLLASLRDRPEVLRRIAAAYVIGWALPNSSLGGVIPLKACIGDNDVGCVISYNARDVGDHYIPGLVRHAINVTENGYRELSDEPIVCWSPIGADSVVSGGCTDDGWLEISTPPADRFDFLMSKGWYHTVEISLFADELRKDAQRRVQAHIAVSSQPPLP
jgi:hypothetical protein